MNHYLREWVLSQLFDRRDIVFPEDLIFALANSSYSNYQPWFIREVLFFNDNASLNVVLSKVLVELVD